MCGSCWRACWKAVRPAVRARASAKKRTGRGRAAGSGGRGDGPETLALELLRASGQAVQRGRAVGVEPESLDDLARPAPFLGGEVARVVRHPFDVARVGRRLVGDETHLAGLGRMLVDALLD